MKKYQAPQIEVTKFEVEDIVTVDFNFSSFSFNNFGGWDKYEDITDNGASGVSDL